MLDLLRVWWSFFWRYSILFILFLLGGGIILNAFAAIWPDAKFLFLITLCYSSIANAIASLIVLLYILNKHLKNSPLILSTVSVEPTLKTLELVSLLLAFPAVFAWDCNTTGRTASFDCSMVRPRSDQFSQIFQIYRQYLHAPRLMACFLAAFTEKREKTITANFNLRLIFTVVVELYCFTYHHIKYYFIRKNCK